MDFGVPNRYLDDTVLSFKYLLNEKLKIPELINCVFFHTHTLSACIWSKKNAGGFAPIICLLQYGRKSFLFVKFIFVLLLWHRYVFQSVHNYWYWCDDARLKWGIWGKVMVHVIPFCLLQLIKWIGPMLYKQQIREFVRKGTLGVIKPWGKMYVALLFGNKDCICTISGVKVKWIHQVLGDLWSAWTIGNASELVQRKIVLG